jgi:hypothetical protein
MVNETLKTLRDPHGVHVDTVQTFEGYEHAHWAGRYRWEATRAGFFTEVTEPHYVPYFGDAEPPAVNGAAPRHTQLRAVGYGTRHFGPARRAYLSWLNNVRGGVSMNMVATKPRRFVGRHEGMRTSERLLRTATAGLRQAASRATGHAAPPLPRTPEQAAERMRSYAH